MDPINMEKLLKAAFEFLDALGVDAALGIAGIIGAVSLAWMFSDLKRLIRGAMFGTYDDEYDETYNADWEAEKERHGWK